MAGLEDYFSIQVFLIVLRETLELAIIISVLLAFLHQSFKNPKLKPELDYSSTGEEGSSGEQQQSNADADNDTLFKYLRLQIWFGGLLGLVVCLLFGSVILAVFYTFGNDLWAVTEHYWEGTFSILASVIISVMGVKILRVNKMQEKWKYKLSTIIRESDVINKVVRGQKNSTTGSLSERFSIWSEKYAMFILPFITTLREGMEAIVFVGGIGINEDTSVWAIANSFALALIIGCTIGVFLYRSGNTLSLQWFLITSTCFLYLVAAGLFSKGVWNFELQRFIDLCDGFDVSETGHGPGSYDITTSIWHVNCCNGEIQEDGAFWMLVTAVFGWTNSATYGSVISYIGYWVVVIATFNALMYEEKHGFLPYIPIQWQKKRIQKNAVLYQRLDAQSRTSLDSVNSATPLQM